MVTFMNEITKTQHDMKYVLVFNSNGMGNATPDLSQLLATNYLKMLTEENHLPAAILFYAEGVKLCCEGSGVTDSLKQLENKGVKLIACATCLNYYNIKDKLVVGNIGTMADIMMYQIHTGKVITL